MEAVAHPALDVAVRVANLFLMIVSVSLNTPARQARHIRGDTWLDPALDMLNKQCFLFDSTPRDIRYTYEVIESAQETTMDNQAPTFSLDDGSFAVEHDVHASKAPRTPVADLTGKGIFDSVSSNRSKMNDQAS
jgi:hypothetical protein